MDSRFAHLRQRDTSVSMLRVKMSRRRSQSQKENRERAVNTRRQLDKLPELEMSSLDASMAVTNMSIIQEKTLNKTKSAKNAAGEERLKQLERWKERKTLEKEKEKRERERKGVFKTGMYHPKDTLVISSLPPVPAASSRAKETKVNSAPSQSIRVTRSMKQQPQQVQRPLKMQDPNTAAKKAQPAVERSTRSRVAPAKPAPAASRTKVCVVEPVARAPPSRSANRPPVTAAPLVKDKPKGKSADVRATRSRAFVAPSSDKETSCKAAVTSTVEPAAPEQPEDNPRPSGPAPRPAEEDMVVDQAPAVGSAEAPSSFSSFAPDGFVFQAPTGLSSFKFEPLTPRSADAFLTPSSSFTLPEVPSFSIEPQAETSKPSPHKSPRCHSPAPTLPTADPPTPGSPLESKHDVPYFRSEISTETDRLTSLCFHWESKVEDESIPEDMRDRMRTAVGQARLLMKERFRQFSGLVDDCELGRGEKITTCTDLQGFWDMVYYQVEDVNRKFDALKEAESRGWEEEHKPPPRQRKVVKKPAATAKPTGTKAAAKSRLAAVKAAMKARQLEEKAAKDAGNDEDNPSLNSQEPQPQAEPQAAAVVAAAAAAPVVFDGGFFQVESPAKPPGSLRRSSRLSAAVLPQASPCSNYLSPRRVTRRSLALAQTPVEPVASPAHLRLTLSQTPAPRSQRGTPQTCHKRKDAVNGSLCFSPVKDVQPEDSQPEGQPSETISASVPALQHLPPSISVVQDKDEPADLPLSPRLSLSPCRSPAAVPAAPEPSSSMSFLLSAAAVCDTPDSSAVEELPGLDFERYLQPSQRCSLSPRDTVAVELSPMAVDVEMESPRSQSEDLLTQQQPGPDG